eukprot:1305972-Rhodomonas_salina.1
MSETKEHVCISSDLASRSGCAPLSASVNVSFSSVWQSQAECWAVELELWDRRRARVESVPFMSAAMRSDATPAMSMPSMATRRSPRKIVAAVQAPLDSQPPSRFISLSLAQSFLGAANTHVGIHVFKLAA